MMLQYLFGITFHPHLDSMFLRVAMDLLALGVSAYVLGTLVLIVRGDD